MPRALRTVTTTTWKGALLVVALAWVMPARAQEHREPSSSGRQTAQRYFEEGVALREAGDAEGAVGRLRRAHALAPSPRTAYNLAAALVDVGRLVEAQRLLRRVVARREDLLVADAASALLERVSPRIGVLDLRVTGATPSHRVLLDGVAVELGPQGLREVAVDPGTHRIEVRDASGVVLARRDVDVGDGERVAIALHPIGAPTATATRLARAPAPPSPASPVDEPAPPATTDESPRRESDDAWLWIGLGAGTAVALAIGAVAIALVLTGQGPAARLPGDLSPVVVRGRDG